MLSLILASILFTPCLLSKSNKPTSKYSLKCVLIYYSLLGERIAKGISSSDNTVYYHIPDTTLQISMNSS